MIQSPLEIQIEMNDPVTNDEYERTQQQVITVPIDSKNIHGDLF